MSNTNDKVNEIQEYLIVYVDDQLFGIPVKSIRDVLSEQKIMNIPLAPPEVVGSLNLRGRIVTAIDLKTILGMEHREQDKKDHKMSIVVEHGEELYSLIVNNVGEVLTLENNQINTNQENLSNNWRDYASGIHAMGEKLVVILNIEKIFSKYDEIQENV